MTYSNNSNAYDNSGDDGYYGSLQKLISLIGYLILFSSLIFVIFSALIVICTVSLNKSLRKPSSYGILTVTFSNLAFCVALLIFVFVDKPNCGSSHHSFWCCFFGHVVTSTIYFLQLVAPVSVAIDRYIAICHPFLYMRRSKAGDTKWIFIGCIIMSMLAGASVLMFKGHGIPEILELLIIFVALSIDITLYVKIFFALKHHVSKRKQFDN